MSDGKRPKFTFEITPEKIALVKAAAIEAGISTSAWIREAIEFSLANELEAEPEREQNEPESERESPSATVSVSGSLSVEKFDALIAEDVPPEPEEMFAEPGQENEFSPNGLGPGSADMTMLEVERVRALHGAPVLCTKTERCEAMIHFPGCPKSTLKAIG